MEFQENLKRPSKDEQQIAMESYSALAAVLEELKTENPEIEIEETQERIKLPLSALKLLAKILKITGEGKPVSIIPTATEVTTQKAAEILGVSRPYLVKLLEEGKIPFTKVGRHRRIRFEDVIAYKTKTKKEQRKYLVEIIRADEELGLYDS